MTLGDAADSAIRRSRPDSLLRHVPLPHTLDLPVLGVPVRFEANSPDLVAAVHRSFGAWAALAERPELCSAARVRVRLYLHDGEEDTTDAPTVHYRLPDPDRLILFTRGSVGVADANQREAFAFVTPTLLAARHQFEYGVVEALTLVLVSAADRYPVHAAAVARGGPAVLLAGPSGVGKSTLAYAAHRTGLRVLGEDVAYVELGPGLRLWGVPGRLHLAPESAAHFPELAGTRPTPLANGKTKVVVSFDPAASEHLPATGTVGVCLLERGSGSAQLEPLPPADIAASLLADLDPGFDRDMDACRRIVHRLAERGGWRLRLSADPYEGLALLTRAFGDGAPGA